MPSAGEQDADSAGKRPNSLPARALSGHKKVGLTVWHRASVQARTVPLRRAGDEGGFARRRVRRSRLHEDRQVPHEPPPCGRTRRCFRLPSRPQHPIVQSRCEPPAGRRRLSYARHGAAWARWPSWSSKPVRSCNPRLGRFDSGAAPLSRNRVSKGILAVSEARLTPPRSALRRLGTS